MPNTTATSTAATTTTTTLTTTRTTATAASMMITATATVNATTTATTSLPLNLSRLSDMLNLTRLPDLARFHLEHSDGLLDMVSHANPTVGGLTPHIVTITGVPFLLSCIRLDSTM